MTRVASEKSPAYQWYPKDYESDESVKLMTYEQEGIYRRLLDHQALHGSIPADLKQIAILVPKVSVGRFMRLWPAIEKQFPLENGRRINRKLERVRARSKAYKETQAENGRKGAESKWRSVAS